MMAVATWIVASTMTGPSTLGSTWRRMMRKGDTPVTRAACTYSLLRSTMVVPRTVRAYCTQPVSEIDTISTPKARESWALGNTARPTPAISSATRIGGKLSMTSHRRIKKLSTQPPKNPASKPNSTPTSTEIITEANPTASEIRAPYINVDKISRPWSSVPSRYMRVPPPMSCGTACAAHDGARRAWSSTSVVKSNGACGATSSANNAQKIQMNATVAAPIAMGEVLKL